MIKSTLVIIDSGLDTNYAVAIGAQVNGIGISIIQGKEITPVISTDYSDKIGHGTAISSIFFNELHDVLYSFNIFVIKIFNSEMSINEEALLFSLNYILNNIECRLLHLSLGIVTCSQLNKLQELCDLIAKKGTVIVAAFDNYGAMSYPASFHNVIGVDTSGISLKKREWAYVDNSPINVLTHKGIVRCQSLEGRRIITEGSSFTSAYISAFLLRKILSGEVLNLSSAIQVLRDNAKLIFDFGTVTPIAKMPIPQKALVFPFNKEMHSLRRFQSKLDFKIACFSDVKYSMNIGIPCDEIIGGKSIIDENILVTDIESVNWNSDFDTVILGHIDLLMAKTHKDYQKYIIEKCIQFNKRIISFDEINIPEYRDAVDIYFQQICNHNIPQNQLGKLYGIGKPVIGIMGTSSKQGKFYIQNCLRHEFIANGYRVGALGTEPHSELFSFNRSLPIGYNTKINFNDNDVITLANMMVHEIEMEDPDLIIIGGQSNTIAYSQTNLMYIPTLQNNLLYACMPDCFVLIVNVFDDLNYIKRSISYLESFGKVIAIVVSEVLKSIPLFSNNDDSKMQELLSTISTKFSIPTYRMNDPLCINKIYSLCIDFF